MTYLMYAHYTPDVTCPIGGARPFEASRQRSKIVPHDLVATVRLALPAFETLLEQLAIPSA